MGEAPGIGVVVSGRYRLDALLGAGGFGAVWRARHLELGHDVAVKLLHAGIDGDAGRRLAREARTLARLDHPGCVRVIDFGTHEGAPFLVMELIAGRSLAVAPGRPWSPRAAVDVAIELLAGLAHAHGLGLVHRDLKPANVLLADAAPAGARVKIIDFGIVTLAAGERPGSFTEQLTRTGKIVGTPRYMSPEQLLGHEVDARSDLYAVGLLLFEMLAGHPAFAAEDERRLAWLHAVVPPPPLPDAVPDELVRLVEQLLAKTPARRPASAERVRERLLALRPALPEDRGALASVRAELDEDLTRSAADPGRRVGPYLLLRELGVGATGVVHLARDERLGRTVALKLLRPSSPEQRASERMVREARGLARVAHPNVVTVFEIGSHRGALFVAMQYVPGRTLRAWLDAGTRPWRETLTLLVQAGRGLAAVHAAGLVHRDVKPENVLVGDDGRARVADFGLARATSPALDMVDRLVAGPLDAASDPLAARLTRTGAIIGTPAYMALEQLAGEQIDARGDQFAFCVLAHEALHGARPFVGDSLEALAARLTAGQIEPRPAGSTVPRRVDEVLARGLAVMPASRWPDMDALLAALERAGGLSAAPPLRWIAVVIAVVLLVPLVGWLSGRETQPVARAEPRPELVDAPRRAPLAWARPDDPSVRREVIELASATVGAMPLEVRAGLHAVAGALHEQHALTELGAVDLLAWSPAGSVLALARREGGVALWDASTRAPARTLAHAGSLASLTLSHDGELLLAREPGGRVLLWHVATGTELGRIDQARLAGFVADTRELVIAGEAGVSLWGLTRGRSLVQTRVVSEQGGVLALTSAGTRVLALHEGGLLRAWSLAGAELGRVVLAGFDAAAGPWVLAPDGDRVVQSDASGLRLWDGRTGRQITTPKLVGTGSASFSPDARWLAVTLRGRAPVLLDARTGERRTTALTPSLATPGLAFDAHGELLALADDGVLEIAELQSGRVVDRIVAAGARMLAVEPGGAWLATVDDDGVARVWARRSVAIAASSRSRRDEGLVDVALAPGGERLAELGRDGRVRWSDPAGPVGELRSEAASWRRIALAGEERLLTLDAGGVLDLGSLPANARVVSLPLAASITALAGSADGTTIAAASGAWPARVELWTRDGQRSRVLVVDGDLRALAFSPDGDLLATAGVGPQVELWSLVDASSQLRLRTAEPEVHALAFSPDAELLAVGGDEAHLWRPDVGFELATLAGPGAPVRALAFSPAGQQVVIVRDDGTRVQRWIDESIVLAEVCRALATAPTNAERPAGCDDAPDDR